MCEHRIRYYYEYDVHTIDQIYSININTLLSIVFISVTLSVHTSGGLFEGQGRRKKKGSYCTTWGPTSVQKAMMHHV